MFKDRDLKKIAEEVIKDVQEEFRLQGHHDTGYLEEHIFPYAASQSNLAIVQIHAPKYAKELNDGVPPNQVKNLSNDEFENLKGWVMRKIGAVSSADATSIAASIVRKWKTNGKPLATSVQFSQTGKVTGAIDDAVEKNEEKHVNLMDDVIVDAIDETFLKIKSETI